MGARDEKGWQEEGDNRNWELELLRQGMEW